MKTINIIGTCVTALFWATATFGQNSDVYKSKCAMCHAADGSGNTPAGKSTKVNPFSSPQVLKLSDADLTADIANGKGKMPAYKGKLTDDQIKELVAYIHTLQKK